MFRNIFETGLLTCGFGSFEGGEGLEIFDIGFMALTHGETVRVYIRVYSIWGRKKLVGYEQLWKIVV